jgi:hypothetical protein
VERTEDVEQEGAAVAHVRSGAHEGGEHRGGRVGISAAQAAEATISAPATNALP